MRGMYHWAVVLAVVTAGAVSAAAETPQEILERVRAKYESVKDAEITFTQRTRLPMSKLEHHGSGTLSLKKENKYRVEMGDQTIVTDGVTVWSYSVPNKQVLIDTYKMNERSLSPDRILAGAPKDFGATTTGREKMGAIEALVLKLVPRGEGSLVSSLRLWVDPTTWLVRKAEVTEVNGKQTTYSVLTSTLNTGLSDARFTLRIPDGVEVVDLR
jgi:chaperone LolA